MEFIENVDKERFNLFVENHPKGHVLQTSEWGEFKSSLEWKMKRVGLEENGELVAVTLLLIRQLPIIHKNIVYCPRGFILDFEAKEILKEFTKNLKKYCKEKLKAIFIKIDPDIPYIEHDIDGNVLENGFNNKHIVEELEDLGFIHKGFSLNFGGIQPRFSFRLNISESEEEIFNNFHHKTRYNIRLAERKGIEIIEGTREDLPKFTELMKTTGERDGFITRPLIYFQHMYDNLVPNGKMKLFLAKYNLDKAFKELLEDFDKTEQEKTKLYLKLTDEVSDKNNKIKKQLKEKDLRLSKIREEIEDIESLKTNYPEGLIIAGTIALITGDKAWYSYGASDNVFRNLMPNYLIQWEMIKWAKSNGCSLYDFRGISGDLSPENPLYGLYKFKRGFSGEFTEFIGEFDLVINKYLYYAWEVLLPKFKKIRKKILSKNK